MRSYLETKLYFWDADKWVPVGTFAAVENDGPYLIVQTLHGEVMPPTGALVYCGPPGLVDTDREDTELECFGDDDTILEDC